MNLVLFKQKEKSSKGSGASKSDKSEVDTQSTYNLPFQNGKSKKDEEESAKVSASKSSKESASPTAEVVPGRLFVSCFILRYILIVHLISHFYISTLFIGQVKEAILIKVKG